MAVALLVVIVAFQIALALGAPWGKAAWGGRHDGVLPMRLRIASGVAALTVYPLIAAALLDASRLIRLDGFLGTSERTVMWGLSGFFVVGSLVNLVSRSPRERWWAPVSLAIAGCCVIIGAAL